MNANTAILGFGATIAATVLTGLGVVLSMVRYINATRLELKGDINKVDDILGDDVKEVRQASASAHTSILSELGEVRAQQAAHTERLNCIDKHLEMSRKDDDE